MSPRGVGATVAAVLTAVLFSACSSVDLSSENPVGVDLSGIWVVDFGASDVLPDFRGRRPKAPRAARGQSSVTLEALRIAQGTAMAFVAHDFQVLRADKLDIELNKDSMGVRYYPGIYRDVSWGERQRGLWEVSAGWENRNLVIVSKAKDLKVVETFRRSAPNQLTVHVEIEAEGDEEAITRIFNRQP